MSDDMRRTTVVLAILSCAIIVACVVVLYGVCTYSFSALMPPAAVTQTSGESTTTTPVTPDGSEDGNGKRQQGIPIATIIGMGLGSTVTFYLLHLRHVDSNISDMQRPMQR